MDLGYLLSKKHKLLQCLNIQPNEKFVHIKEDGVIDSNFILMFLIKHILSEKDSSLCLVTSHNSIDHYISVGKKIGFDFQTNVDNNRIKYFDLIEHISDNLICGTNFFDTVFEYLENDRKGTTYVIIEDLSHFLDLNYQISDMLKLINKFANLSHDRNINFYINNHCSEVDIDENEITPKDRILSNALEYLADVNITVADLYTGKSEDVTGVIYIQRYLQGSADIKNYQYKTTERDVKVFLPGEGISHLRMH